MKKQFLFFIAIASCFVLEAQQIDTTWLRQYDRVSFAGKVNITEVNTNKFIAQHGERYYEINGAGDSLTSGKFDTALGTLGPRSFASDGNYHYAGGWSGGGPSLAKLDTNYNILWNTTTTTSSFGQGVEAILLDSNYIYVSGSHSSMRPFIAKLDSTGAVVWHKDFSQTSFSNLTNLIKLGDGRYLASGNRDDYPLAIKFDTNGDTSWSYTENIFISFTYAAAAEKANGNMVMVMRNKIIELDTSGARVDSVHALNEYRDIFRKGDTLYLFGTHRDQQFGSNNYAFVETRNLNLDSTNAWIYNWNSFPMANNVFDDVLQTSTGGFIASGKHRDSINTSANTYNVLIGRFNDSLSNTNTSIRTVGMALRPNQLYPNPANNKLFVDVDLATEVTLIDLLGYSVTLKIKNGHIETNTVPSGFYIIMVKTYDSYYTGKVLIQH